VVSFQSQFTVNRFSGVFSHSEGMLCERQELKKSLRIFELTLGIFGLQTKSSVYLCAFSVKLCVQKTKDFSAHPALRAHLWGRGILTHTYHSAISTHSEGMLCERPRAKETFGNLWAYFGETLGNFGLQTKKLRVTKTPE